PIGAARPSARRSPAGSARTPAARSSTRAATMPAPQPGARARPLAPSSENADDTVQLGFGVDQIDPFGGDPKAVARPAQTVLDQGAPDTLALVATLEHDQPRADPH